MKAMAMEVSTLHEPFLGFGSIRLIHEVLEGVESSMDMFELDY
jgi:hypothetical protein